MLQRLIIMLALTVWGTLPAKADDTCVVLLHGLARGADSMAALEQRLRDAGFMVSNIDYPYRSGPVAALAEQAVGEGITACEQQQAGRISFVTHSLGGILVRQYFATHHHPQLHRVVMLGPPNQGSEVVNLLRRVPGYTLVTGTVGTQLGTDMGSVPRQLPPVDFEMGVIAGKFSLNPFFDLVVPDPNDGTVSVDSTRVEGMKEHIVLSVSHTLMMYSGRVMDNTVHFLKTGQFLPVESGA
ncbi:MAG: hypothetical protein RLZZ385_195 [Pseudomonadota bacterium]|jgi:pimeloyl-ACP methyl ester carboxylesterase